MQPDDVYQKQVMAFSARLRRELAGEVVAQEKQINPAARATSTAAGGRRACAVRCARRWPSAATPRP